MSLINIVIPTCNRPDTLFWAVKSCLNQSYDDYKIWIVDASTDDRSFHLIKKFDDEIITYIRNPGTSMVNNWEFALKHIKEGYVMFIGDDDGLVSDSLKYIPELIEKTGSNAIKFYPVIYYWPDLNHFYKNFVARRIYIYRDKILKSIDSKQILQAVNEKLELYPDTIFLPSIYYGLINIEIINKIKKRDERFFHSSIPDVYSSIIIAGEIDNYVFSTLPVCINGTSKSSTGLANKSISKVNTEAKKARGRFYGEKRKLFHNLLETEKLKLNMHQDSVVIAECFLQANIKNKEIPSIRIENLIKKIVDFDLYYAKSDEEYNAVIESIMIIARINNLETFANKTISESEIMKKEQNNSETLARELIKNSEKLKIIPDKLFVLDSEEINNVYDASLFIAENYVQREPENISENTETIQPALDLIKTGKFDDAINILTNMINQGKDNYDIWNSMAICHLKTGKKNLANIYYEKARKFLK